MRTRRLILSFWLMGCQLALATTALGQEESVFDRVSEAYQVNRLMAAKTIRLEEQERLEFPAHDYGPDFHEMSFRRQHYVLDIENQRGSRESLTESASTFFHNHRILRDGKSMRIIYGPDVYIDEGDRAFISEFGGTIRAYDPMLAMWLVKSSKSARIEDDEIWMGILHDKVTVDFPGSPPLTIFVNKDTGYISKMSRIVGEETKVSYTFDRHKVRNGIAIATETNVYGGREKLSYTFNRRIVLDDQNDLTAFDKKEGLLPQPKRVDQSVVTIDEISETMYHAGQGVAYTTFIKTGDGLVAYGLAGGFSERLEAYRSRTGDHSPVSYGIVTDHHQIELAGATEAAKLGATLLITTDAMTRTEEATEEVTKVNIEIIDSPRNIGSLKIIPISTSHASKALVGYESDDRVLVQKGHWVKWFESEPVWADISDLTLYKALLPYNLEIDKLLSTDGRGTGDWVTFVSQVESYEWIPCHGDRPICRDWP